MRYPGGKNGAGTYQRLINLIPFHRTYVEAFAGSASIFFHKRLAETSILLDRDRDQCRALRARISEECSALKEKILSGPIAFPTVIVADALHWLTVAQHVQSPETFLYCDPPYLPSTRSDPERAVYKYEMTNEAHGQLLEILLALPCKIMLSGYPSRFYNRYLTNAAGWREIQFRVMTRGGNSRLESLWMNYPQPYELHDYSYLGDNYRKRQDFKRLRARWLHKIEGMDDLRRYALLSALADAKTNMPTANERAIKKARKTNGSDKEATKEKKPGRGNATGHKRATAGRRRPGRTGKAQK